MPTRIGNRSYPPVLSDAQKGVMADLLNDPGWGSLVADQPQTRIGNRAYPLDQPVTPPMDKGPGGSNDVSGYLDQTRQDFLAGRISKQQYLDRLDYYAPKAPGNY